MQVLADGRRVGFTLREFELFSVLAERQGRVVRRSEIYGLIWGGEMRPRDRSVDVLVRKVRAKLAGAAPDWAYVHTHFGIGYRFEPEPSAAADKVTATLPPTTSPAQETAPEARARTDAMGALQLSAPTLAE